MPGYDYLAVPTIRRLQTVRAAAALPAASAWDAAPLEIACPGMDYALFIFRYTRAAAGGDMQFRIEISPYLVDAEAPANHPAWVRAALFGAGGVVSGADTLSNIQRQDIEYGSTAVGDEDFPYGPLELLGTVQRIRVPCHESGVAGTPGDCSIDVAFGVRGW